MSSNFSKIQLLYQLLFDVCADFWPHISGNRTYELCLNSMKLVIPLHFISWKEVYFTKVSWNSWCFSSPRGSTSATWQTAALWGNDLYFVSTWDLLVSKEVGHPDLPWVTGWSHSDSQWDSKRTWANWAYGHSCNVYGPTNVGCPLPLFKPANKTPRFHKNVHFHLSILR